MFLSAVASEFKALSLLVAELKRNQVPGAKIPGSQGKIQRNVTEEWWALAEMLVAPRPGLVPQFLAAMGRCCDWS